MEDGGWRMWRERAGQHERMNPGGGNKEKWNHTRIKQTILMFWRFMLMIQINTTGGSWFWFSLVHGGVKLPLISWDCHTLPSSCTKEDDACLNCSWLCWNFIFHLQKQQKIEFYFGCFLWHHGLFWTQWTSSVDKDRRLMWNTFRKRRPQLITNI